MTVSQGQRDILEDAADRLDERVQTWGELVPQAYREVAAAARWLRKVAALHVKGQYNLGDEYCEKCGVTDYWPCQNRAAAEEFAQVVLNG